ncbi:MAG: LytTR family DNA-binding domain-containing protein [Bacteroidetes bacterium]|nr:LytTR family DNA-binding domain-containing protein [Bacteroidota bacterium]
MLRCLIADDEAPARSRLRRLLLPYESNGRVVVVAEAADGVEAVKALNEHDVDLAFLDVQMPGLDGFDVLDQADPDRRPDVVFTTAYSDYALRAFDANAVDYLLKPIERERLDEALVRVERRAAARAPHAPRADERLARLLDWFDRNEPGNAPAPSRPGEFLSRLSVPYKDRLLVLPVADVLSVEVHDGITRLYALTGEAEHPVRQYLVSHTLDHFESLFDPAAFLRVHRSSLVQVAHIREMMPWFSGRMKLLLTGGHEVIASRERSRTLREMMLS